MVILRATSILGWQKEDKRMMCSITLFIWLAFEVTAWSKVGYGRCSKMVNAWRRLLSSVRLGVNAWRKLIGRGFIWLVYFSGRGLRRIYVLFKMKESTWWPIWHYKMLFDKKKYFFNENWRVICLLSITVIIEKWLLGDVLLSLTSIFNKKKYSFFF
jgi:hypothetical protein